ncbi:hypothetical protein [Sulfolobus acidocaldarius]|uniref:hypothetical protein n=1 Tax=Sulfolobus acidocaldarius TaxID=2285 RepID=UPI001E5DAFAA|nr:hypothetical protein [Sulfolobus acidocaldarius]
MYKRQTKYSLGPSTEAIILSPNSYNLQQDSSITFLLSIVTPLLEEHVYNLPPFRIKSYMLSPSQQTSSISSLPVILYIPFEVATRYIN